MRRGNTVLRRTADAGGWKVRKARFTVRDADGVNDTSLPPSRPPDNVPAMVAQESGSPHKRSTVPNLDRTSDKYPRFQPVNTHVEQRSVVLVEGAAKQARFFQVHSVQIHVAFGSPAAFTTATRSRFSRNVTYGPTNGRTALRNREPFSRKTSARRSLRRQPIETRRRSDDYLAAACARSLSLADLRLCRALLWAPRCLTLAWSVSRSPLSTSWLWSRLPKSSLRTPSS